MESKLQGNEASRVSIGGKPPYLRAPQGLKTSDEDFGLQEGQIFTPSCPLKRGGQDTQACEFSIFTMRVKKFTVPLRSCLLWAKRNSEGKRKARAKSKDKIKWWSKGSGALNAKVRANDAYALFKFGY